MIRRTYFRAGTRFDPTLLVIALGGTLLLVGCGGSGGGNGGGGGGPQVCGSAANATAIVLCGTVVGGSTDSTTTSAVAGASVAVTDLAGNVLAQSTTDATGTYKFTTVPSGTKLIKVDPPNSTFFSGVMKFGGATYITSRQNRAGTGPCLPAIGPFGAGDNTVQTTTLLLASGPPYSPDMCPR